MTDLFIRNAWARIRTVTAEGKQEILHLFAGDPIPLDKLAEGELERLKTLGIVGRKAAVTIASAPTREPAAAEITQVADLEVAKLAEYTDEELAAGIKSVGVKKILTAVASDAGLAVRLIAAEKAATSGDPRSSLIKPLEKLVAAAA